MVLVKRIAARGLLATVLLGVALLAAFTLGTSAAFGAGPPASCMGHEASSISPPGSSAEVPGGMPELVRFFKENVPGPQGASISTIAKLHEGSHEACDEALEG
jgi:hypothetical protein